MNRNQKEAVVAEVSKLLDQAEAIILTDFTGLKVEQMTELRRRIKEKDQQYLVIKNTLFRLAAKDTDAEQLSQYMVGPNGVGVSHGEPVDLAKVLVDFAKDNKALDIKTGLLQGKLIDAEDVKALAKLPDRDTLLAMLLGAMNGVSRNLVSVLAAVPRGLLNALKAIEEQKAEAA